MVSSKILAVVFTPRVQKWIPVTIPHHSPPHYHKRWVATSLNSGNFCFGILSAYWISILWLKFSHLWTIFFWTNFYCKHTAAFSIFRVIVVFCVCQGVVQWIFYKLGDSSLLREHAKQFSAPNSSLGKGFFAYDNGFEWFEHVPHSPHFLCEQNEGDRFVDDHKHCPSLKISLLCKHDARSLLVVGEACLFLLHYVPLSVNQQLLHTCDILSTLSFVSLMQATEKHEEHSVGVWGVAPLLFTLLLLTIKQNFSLQNAIDSIYG